jgi:hypothetical protein
MPDGATPERVESSKDATCFPVTKEAVDKTLSKIAEDPVKVTIEDSTLLQIENPELNLGLMSIRSVFKSHCSEESFSEGAVWTYKILKEQAMLRGKKVPKVSKTIINTHMQDEMAFITNLMHKKAPSTRGIFEGTWLRMEEISQKDMEFGKAIKELVKYRTDKDGFYHGVISTYLPFKRMEEAQKLENKFNL